MTAPADLLAGLHDVRHPRATGAEALADGLAGAGLGLLLAGLLVLALRRLTRRAVSRDGALLAELEAARGLETGRRLLAQAKILERLAARGDPESGLRARLREALYRPDPGLDPAAVEGEIRALIARRGGW
jgi:hypothetical protein